MSAGFFGEPVFVDSEGAFLQDGSIVRVGYRSPGSDPFSSSELDLLSAGSTTFNEASALFDGFLVGDTGPGTIDQFDRPGGAPTNEIVVNSANALADDGGVSATIEDIGTAIGLNASLYLFAFNEVDTSAIPSSISYGIFGIWETTQSPDVSVVTTPTIDTVLRGSETGDGNFMVVPEPATYAVIFGFISLGVALIRRRRRVQA